MSLHGLLLTTSSITWENDHTKPYAFYKQCSMLSMTWCACVKTRKLTRRLEGSNSRFPSLNISFACGIQCEFLHYSSHYSESHGYFRNHSNMLIWCWRNISTLHFTVKKIIACIAFVNWVFIYCLCCFTQDGFSTLWWPAWGTGMSLPIVRLLSSLNAWVKAPNSVNNFTCIHKET